MPKLIIQNIGWNNKEKVKHIQQSLIPLVKKISTELQLKNNIIIHLYEAKNNGDRSEYDEGVIIILENSPDYRSDFLHELGHQLFREERISITVKAKLNNLQRELEKNKGDGRIFLQEHTYKNAKEIFCTLFKWFILGKCVDEGYLEVLRNFQPKAEKLIEKIIKEEDLIKSKEMPIGTISAKTGLKKFGEGDWRPVEKEKTNKNYESLFENRIHKLYYKASRDLIYPSAISNFDKLFGELKNISLIKAYLKKNNIDQGKLKSLKIKFDLRNSDDFPIYDYEKKTITVPGNFLTNDKIDTHDTVSIFVHELTHYIQDLSGRKSDERELEIDKYIKMAHEKEAYINQIKYLSDVANKNDKEILKFFLSFKFPKNIINKFINESKDNIQKSFILKSGYKLAGRTNFQGMNISLEHKKGGVREGVDVDGKKWKTKFKVPYGYILNTTNKYIDTTKDGECLDCFIGNNKNSDKVFIVRQINPKTKEYDEDKVMLGFNKKSEAEKMYLSHYNRTDHYDGIEETDIDTFKDLVFSQKKIFDLQKYISKKRQWV